jgi:NAD(P)H-dependent FMN reductase
MSKGLRMNNTTKILVLAGTTRLARKSILAAKLIAKVGGDIENVETKLADPVDFVFNGDGNDPEGKDARYTELTAWADGFFIVTPEYNHSFPGSLKRMLDSELENYIHKPVVLAGVSSGGWGGVRAVESLVPAVREMGLVVTFTDVYFPRIQEMFDEYGNPFEERTIQSIQKAYKELLWMSDTLKYGRDNIKYR